MQNIGRRQRSPLPVRGTALALIAILSFVACDHGDSKAVVAPKRLGDTSVETVPGGTAANLVVKVLNNDPDAARIVIDFNGSRAVDHRFPGSSGNPHPAVYTFEYRLPGDAVDVAARAGDHSERERVELSNSPTKWVVVQNYGSDEPRIEVTTYTERPKFG